MYPWALNKTKLDRAIKGEGDEFAIIERYIALGGKVDERNLPTKPIEQPVIEAIAPVETVVEPITINDKPLNKKTNKRVKKD